MVAVIAVGRPQINHAAVAAILAGKDDRPGRAGQKPAGIIEKDIVAGRLPSVQHTGHGGDKMGRNHPHDIAGRGRIKLGAQFPRVAVLGFR